MKEGQPELSFLRFDPFFMLEQIRSEFPELSGKYKIELVLKRHALLACVRQRKGEVLILVHSILNHEDTPREVIEVVLRHELLHLIIPPREVDGKHKSHPPEFWEAEDRVSPTRALAWNWLFGVLGLNLRRDQKREAVLVLRGWEKQMRHPRPGVNLDMGD